MSPERGSTTTRVIVSLGERVNLRGRGQWVLTEGQQLQSPSLYFYTTALLTPSPSIGLTGRRMGK